MPFDEDLSLFFDETEHATAGVIAGVGVLGVFDHDYNEVLESATEHPTFLCPESSARCAVGDTITVGGTPYTVVGREPDGTGLALLELEELLGAAGEGIHFNFNQPFIIAPAGYKQNDHSLFYVEATGLWHLIGIRCLLAETGSAVFSHYTSPDLRTWTELAEISVGDGEEYDWRFICYAPFIMLNPNYGGSGSLSTYKYLMFATGVSRQGGSTQKQKIGLWATNDDSLATWEIQNADAPIYWTGMATATYPDGAPWCPASTYDSSYGGASRDPWVFTDGEDYYLIVTCKKGGDTGGQQLGLAKFSGKMIPNWLDVEHEPTPLITPSSSGLLCEGSCLIKHGALYTLFTLLSGYRMHAASTDKLGPPWSTSSYAGQVVGDEGPSSVSACEVVPLEDEVYLLSGHKYSSVGYWYKFNELDFADLAEGGYPVESSQAGIAGLVALSGGVMDRSIRFHHGSAGGYGDAFYYEPVMGDEPAAAGGDASGMTGNSYLNTAFKRSDPTKTAGYAATVTWGGWVYTDAFTITKRRAELAIAGDKTGARRFVALVRDSDNSILHLATGHDSHVLRTVSWDLSQLQGETVRLVVADLSDTDNPKTYGISLDYFREFTPADGDADASPVIPAVMTDRNDFEEILSAAGADVSEVPW